MGAARIAIDEGSDRAQCVIHIFPNCDMTMGTMTTIAPDLLGRVAEIEHMVT